MRRDKKIVYFCNTDVEHIVHSSGCAATTAGIARSLIITVNAIIFASLMIITASLLVTTSEPITDTIVTIIITENHNRKNVANDSSYEEGKPEQEGRKWVVT